MSCMSSLFLFFPPVLGISCQCFPSQMHTDITHCLLIFPAFFALKCLANSDMKCRMSSRHCGHLYRRLVCDESTHSFSQMYNTTQKELNIFCSNHASSCVPPLLSAEEKEEGKRGRTPSQTELNLLFIWVSVHDNL